MDDVFQLKAARNALDLTRRQLADASGVSSETIKRLEKQSGKLRGNVTTIAAIQTALESAGVEFIPENGGGAGVRLKKGARVPQVNGGDE